MAAPEIAYPPLYNSFTSGSYPFPDDNKNPEEKSKSPWLKKVAEAIFAQYLTGGTVIPYSIAAKFAHLRALSGGEQDVARYKKILLDKSEPTDEEKGFLNIYFEVLTLMPKFLRVVQGILEQADHQVVATAVDQTSLNEKEDLALDMAFKMKYRAPLSEVNKTLGINDTETYIPESPEELELYREMGGFKLLRENTMETAVDYTLSISNWKEIEDAIEADLISLNCACVKDYTDNQTGKVRARYVNPEYFVGSKMSSTDNLEMRFAGEIIQEDIASIMRQDPSMDPAVLLKLVNSYNGKNGNPQITIEDSNSKYSLDAKYNNFMINVLDFEYKSIDYEYWDRRVDSHDTENLRKSKVWGKVLNSEKQKTEIYNIHTVYCGKWIIGTDIVYDGGKKQDIVRPGHKDVRLSYTYISRPGRSITSLAEPAIHAIALAHLKYQNAVAQAAPPGIAIEYSSILNLSLSDNKLKPIEILRMRRQNGDIVYKATTHKGVPNVSGGYKPIQELMGGAGSQLKEFIDTFNVYTNVIREVTGVNQIADASNPNPEMSVGGSEMALASTNNSLRFIYTAGITLKERLASNICQRVQMLIRSSKKSYQGYYPVLGGGVRLLNAGSEVIDSDYYIKLEAKPTRENAQKIRDAAIAALAPGKDGSASLEYSDYLLIERALFNGKLKAAEIYLNFKMKRNKALQLKLQRENMALDAQREQQSIALKEQMFEKQERFKTDEKIRFEKEKAGLTEAANAAAHNRKKEQIALEKTLGTALNQNSANTTNTKS